jgi:hypothetical protein
MMVSGVTSDAVLQIAHEATSKCQHTTVLLLLPVPGQFQALLNRVPRLNKYNICIINIFEFSFSLVD